MNAGIKMTFNNSYHVELIDAASGEVKQTGDFKNLVVNSALCCLTGSYDYQSTASRPSGLQPSMMSYCGIGTGTATPQRTDTSIARIGSRIKRDADNFEWVNDYTGRNTCVYTFPATSEYVGTVTEIGLYNNGGNLMTHSLLTDSEGQQISFVKTDLDILKITVTVELTMSSSTSGFVLFKKPRIIYYSLVRYTENYYSGGFTSSYGILNAVRFYRDLEYEANDGSNASIDLNFSNTDVTSYVQNSAGNISYSVARIPNTQITSERYYKAFAVPAFGYWKLPNEDVFPAYSIIGISVGVGDGSTTQFNNPLSYFKKNSEKVYKNGALLTRGADYTINNVGNIRSLPELADFVAPISIASGLTKRTSGAQLCYPSNLQYALTPSIDFDNTFNSTHPLYIEYADEVTLNCLSCLSNLQEGSYDAQGVSFFVDYSTDGTVYHEVGSLSGNTRGQCVIDFTETTAKYWRIRTNSTSEIWVYHGDSTISTNQMVLFKKDPYITFTSAPAVGDVITMDVSMDLVMKNSNFVIEAGCTLDFTL